MQGRRRTRRELFIWLTMIKLITMIISFILTIHRLIYIHFFSLTFLVSTLVSTGKITFLFFLRKERKRNSYHLFPWITWCSTCLMKFMHFTFEHLFFLVVFLNVDAVISRNILFRWMLLLLLSFMKNLLTQWRMRLLKELMLRQKLLIHVLRRSYCFNEGYRWRCWCRCWLRSQGSHWRATKYGYLFMTEKTGIETCRWFWSEFHSLMSGGKKWREQVEGKERHEEMSGNQ